MELEGVILSEISHKFKKSGVFIHIWDTEKQSKRKDNDKLKELSGLK